MLTLLCLPVMLAMKDKKKQERLNMAVCRVIYSPVCLTAAMYFTVCNILLLPFAFLKTLRHKYLLWKRYDEDIYR